MPCFRLPKHKLLPSKKACKSFLSTINSHFRRLRRRSRSTTSVHRLRCRPNQYASAFYVEPLVPVRRPVAAPEASRGGGRKWKEYLESLPAIRGVDERAEEFITNFRQQMKIEREQSLLDFQEMLARST